jgi:tetratricopeptide (TPR) repeat protein
MGVFFLLTLYSSIRASAAQRPARWEWTAVIACALGMATKEVMVVAPLIVLLYDRAFVFPSFRDAFRQRFRLYGGLFATWLIALGLNANRPRAESVGSRANVLLYLENQCWALSRYMKLLFWPSDLVMDYGPPRMLASHQIVPGALLAAVLIGATLVAFRFAPALGFLGAWFLLILLPSSSVMPIMTEAAAERRVYLSLAAPLVLAVTAVYVGAKRHRPIAVALFAVLGVLLANQTTIRNAEYATERRAWQTVVDRFPHARAYAKLGFLVDEDGDVGAAIPLYRKAIQEGDREPATHWNLAHALQDTGNTSGALAEYMLYARLQPQDAIGRATFGAALLAAGRLTEARSELREAVRLKPDLPEPYANLGFIALEEENYAEAANHFQSFTQLEPDNAVILRDLGLALMGLHRFDEAIDAFAHALRVQPDFPEAKENLAAAHAMKAFQDRENAKRKGPAEIVPRRP